MTAFRWAAGVLVALLATSALLSYLVSVVADVPVWLARARRLRHWAWLTLLLWFNVEVWGRVAAGVVKL